MAMFENRSGAYITYVSTGSAENRHFRLTLTRNVSAQAIDRSVGPDGQRFVRLLCFDALKLWVRPC